MSMERSKFLVGGKRNTLAMGAAGEGGVAPPARKYKQRSHSPLWQRQAVMNAGLGLAAPKRRGGGGVGKAPTVVEALRAVGVGNGATTVAAIAGAERKSGRANRRGTGNPRQQQQHPQQQFTDKSHTTATIAGSGPKRKRVQRGHFDFPATKWLLKPQSNFRHTSESSSSEDDDDEDVDQTAATPSLMSSPPGSSPTLETPPQPQIVLSDELKQTREATPATTTTTAKKIPPPVPKKPKMKRQSHLSVVSCKSISSGYHTLMDSSNDEDSVWCKEKNYDRPIVVSSGRNKSLKLTATVIKIVPEPIRAVAGAETVETFADSKQPVQTKLQEQPCKLPQQQFKPMLQPQQQQQQQQLKPPSQQEQQQQLLAKPATVAQPAVPKIVRVDQHKVPRTIEDGIDISYQYFVNLPLARGKKPMPIRYLYRPMVRRLNGATPSRHSSKRSKKSSTTQSEATTDHMDLNDQIELNDSQEDEAQKRIDGGDDNDKKEDVDEERVETERLTEQDKAAEQEGEDVSEQEAEDVAEPVAVEKEQSVESSEVYTDPEEQAIIEQQLLMEQLKRQQFAMYAPPPIVLPQKYSPLVKLLNRHPMPKEQTRPMTSLPLQQQLQKQRQLREQQLQYLRQLTQGNPSTGTEPQTSEFNAKFLPLFEKLNRQQLQQQEQLLQQHSQQQQEPKPQQQQLTKLQQLQHAELEYEQQQQQQQLKRLQHEQEQLQFLQEQLQRKQQLNQVQQQQLLASRQLQLLQQQQQQKQLEAQKKRPTLIDYQTKSTRLDTADGVNISFHAPIRMGAGGEQITGKVAATDAKATKAAATEGTTAAAPATPTVTATAAEPNCTCNKCVSFKLDKHKHTSNSTNNNSDTNKNTSNINKNTSNINKNTSNTSSNNNKSNSSSNNYRRANLQSAGDGNEELSKGKPQQKLPTLLQEDEELRRKKKSKHTRGKKRSHK